MQYKFALHSYRVGKMNLQQFLLQMNKKKKVYNLTEKTLTGLIFAVCTKNPSTSVF